MGNEIQKQDSSFLEILSQPIVLTALQRINASDTQQIIFHNKNVSTQYFIRFLTQFPQEHQIQTHQQFLDLLMTTRHPFIVPLFYYQMNTCVIPSIPSEVARVVCSNHPMLESYYLFYNFSLRQVVNRGFVSSKSPRFKQQELWYIASALIQILKNLAKFSVSMGGITTKDIMLTPTGEIQYYPNKLRIGIRINNLDNSHAVFFEVIKTNKAILNGYLPPQQLTNLKKANFILPDLINTLKAGDMFCLGMILLQCISFQCSEKYYSISAMDVQMGMIGIKLRALHQNRIVSAGLIDFVSKCLDEKVKTRITLNQADKIVQSYPKARNLTFIAQNSLEYNALTTRKSSEMSTFSHTTHSLKLRHR